MTVDNVRENLYFLALQMEETGKNESWVNVLLDARDYLTILMVIQEKGLNEVEYILNVDYETYKETYKKPVEKPLFDFIRRTLR